MASAGSMTAFDYDSGTRVVTGVGASWNVTKLRHVPGTGHLFVDNPDYIPAGACRAVAIRWNLGVFQNKSDAYFTRLINTSANQNCSFQFDAGAVGIDGAQDANWMRPAPSQ